VVLSSLVTVRVPRAETTGDGMFPLTNFNALTPEMSDSGHQAAMIGQRLSDGFDSSTNRTSVIT